MVLKQMEKGLQPLSINQIERTVDLLDKGARMPVLPIRFPLDPIVGIVPGLGDMVTLFISGSIISHARKLGAPRSMLRRMAANVLIDCVFGCVPFLGDVFDFFYKANQKNLRLLKDHLASATQESGHQGRRQL